MASSADTHDQPLADSRVQSAFCGWSLSLYPAAGEAGGGWVQGTRERSPAVGGGDPERSRVEAARRAKSQVRRYCTANGLNRLGTLTYAGSGNHDPVVLRQHLAKFFRRLRVATGDKAFAYVWVPEWHKSGHGLHAHFAVGRYLKRRDIEGAWGHGFVHIKLLGDLPVGSGRLAEARRAARYLSKYAGKDFDHEHMPGLHRYEVAQGFQPEKVTVRAVRLGDAIAQASEIMGRAPSYRWDSSMAAEPIDGPPRAWFSWD